MTARLSLLAFLVGAASIILGFSVGYGLADTDADLSRLEQRITQLETPQPRPSARADRTRPLAPALRRVVPVASPTTVQRGLPAVLLAIRECESGGDYRAENTSSSASGAWQFIGSTWTATTGLRPPASAYPRRVQDAAALKLYRQQGAAPWNASRRCWS